jgi:hypothetical protein
VPNKQLRKHVVKLHPLRSIELSLPHLIPPVFQVHPASRSRVSRRADNHRDALLAGSHQHQLQIMLLPLIMTCQDVRPQRAGPDVVAARIAAVIIRFGRLPIRKLSSLVGAKPRCPLGLIIRNSLRVNNSTLTSYFCNNML